MRNFLSFKEASEYLKVSKATLYKLTSNREIKFYKPNGGKIYFKIEDLDNWIESGSILTKNEVFSANVKLKNNEDE